MATKKMGRPTDNPKNIMVRVRMDNETIKKLDVCVKITNSNRSEIIRQSIERLYDDLTN